MDKRPIGVNQPPVNTVFSAPIETANPSVHTIHDGADGTTPTRLESASTPVHTEQLDPMALPQHAQDYIALLSVATNSVSTITSVAQMAMGGFALMLAILGILGFMSIRRAVTGNAEKMLKEHLGGEHFKNKVDTAIVTAVQVRLSGMVILQSGGNGGNEKIGPLPPGDK